MKKIVSAVVVGAMVAGSAFAEVKISNNFRIRPVPFQFDSGTEEANRMTLWSMDDGLATGQNAKDTLTFESKNDYAGVKFAFSNGVSKGSSAVGIDSYNGFLKFGDLTFTGGLFDSRVANRVTKDQNNLSFIEQNWGAKSVGLSPKEVDKKFSYENGFEQGYLNFAGTKKLGVNPNMFTPISFVTGDKYTVKGVDSDNITAIEGTKALSFVVDYVLADVGGGRLQLWGALNKKDDNWVTTNDDGETTTVVNSGYAFRADYRMDDFAITADLHITKENLVAAIFFSPLSVENLIATAGFTFAKDSSTGDDGSIYWAIDARARYALDDAMAIGLYLNYSSATIEDADAIGVLDAVMNFNYKLSDIVTAFIEGEFALQTNSDVKDRTGHQLAAQAGGIFTAGKGAEIDAAIRLAMAGLGNDVDQDILGLTVSIPVCMRIKL